MVGMVVCLVAIALNLPTSVHGWVSTTSSRSEACHYRSRVGCCSTSLLTKRASKERRTWTVNAAAKKSEEEKDPARVIYSQPVLYDLAFGYRDYVGEVEFLLEQHARLSRADGASASTSPLTILELAAGPARHALTALSLLSSQEANDDGDAVAPSRVYCVDASPEMAAYAQRLVSRTDEERLRRHESSQPLSKLADQFVYTVSDMRTIALLPDAVDTAWILLGSLQHLLTNADVLSCFQSIHALLRDNGTLFIELPHPREIFGIGDCTRNSWKVPLTFETDENGRTDDSTDLNDDEEYEDETDKEDDEDKSSAPNAGELSILWGDAGDLFDPVTQVRQFTIAMEWMTDDAAKPIVDLPPSGTIRQVVPLRVFTVPEITALAQCAGFHVAAMYGALEDDVSIHDEEASYRFVCVLQKR